MNTYAIRRLKAWGSPEELEQVAARSKNVAADEFPQDIRWIRSYVIAEEDGKLGTVCIYQATSTEAIRDHAHRVGMPADQIWDVADTVVIRPDPVAEPRRLSRPCERPAAVPAKGLRGPRPGALRAFGAPCGGGMRREPGVGLEPTTPSLPWRCSTAELSGQVGAG